MRRRPWLLACVCALVAVAGRAFPAAAQTDRPSPVLSIINSAFDAAYNLDIDHAVSVARQAATAAPNDAYAHRALASIIWLDILFHRGAVTVDSYLNGVTKSQLNLPKPDADLDTEFKQELARAIALAGAEVKQNAGDVQARYNLGAAYGLQASYAASVDGSVGSAFASARHAYDAEETVLDADPRRVGAGVIVGTYRYLVASMSLPARMFAYMAGFGGDKERGIALVEGATHDPETHVEAKTALVLIYSREGRDLDAARLLRELAGEFPRNRLFVLEEASAYIRANHPADAEPLLSAGLDAFLHDSRPKMPGEQALWLYKRGVARVLLKQLPGAETDLDAALENNPVPWIRGRIDLYLGKAADLLGHRDAAVAEYQRAEAVSRGANDPLAADEADRLSKHPFSLK